MQHLMLGHLVLTLALLGLLTLVVVLQAAVRTLSTLPLRRTAGGGAGRRGELTRTA